MSTPSALTPLVFLVVSVSYLYVVLTLYFDMSFLQGSS